MSLHTDSTNGAGSAAGKGDRGAYAYADIPPKTNERRRKYASSFLEHLVQNKIVSEQIAGQASEWIAEKNGKEKRKLVDLLEEEYGVSREVLSREVAQFYAFRIVDINDRSIRRLTPSLVNRMLDALPAAIYRLAMRHKVLPHETADGQADKILVVTPNPSDREVCEVARALPYAKFEICFMKETDWNELWQELSVDRQQSVSGAKGGDSFFEENEAELETALTREIESSQLIALVANIFTDAVRVGASDIHIVPRGSRKTEVSFRIDGQLSSWYTIADARAEAVIAVVKGHAQNIDRFERMAAQDGSAQKIIGDKVVRFRLSVLPIISKELSGKFESVVIRILKDADASITLQSIGLDKYSLGVFKEAISKPHGMVILTGPTGSGKSTTLVAALRSVMRPSVNTLTVEDPVEYLLEGARQIKLNHKLSFDDAIRAILRHDPDIIMVGEIRDKVTADIAIKLANTGHLTFSTLHTNDAAGVVSRLFKIGVEPFLIAQALNIVVAQRLVRKLCDRCKQPLLKVNPQNLVRAGFQEDELSSLQLFKPVGCVNCVGGYKGRTAIHESLYASAEVRDVILESAENINTELLREAGLRHGMRTLRRTGLDLVKSGVTSLEEILSTTTID